jgi:hypothetical protein
VPDPGDPTTEPDWAITTGRQNHGDRYAQTRLDIELGTVRGELGRVDAKASTLLALAGVLLGGGLAALASADPLPTAAAVPAWAAAATVGAATLCLAAAIRPRLDGDFGFLRWAGHNGAAAVLTHLIDEATPPGSPLLDRSHELHCLSRAAYAKYVHVSRAVTLLIAGLGLGAVATAVAVWAR